MEKLNQFFKDHGNKLISILLILIYFKSCGMNRDITRLKKEFEKTSVVTSELIIESSDLTIDLIKELPTNRDLKIEGLNVEKRMIQATNRKMLDVQRQNEIEREIKRLQEN